MDELGPEQNRPAFQAIAGVLVGGVALAMVVLGVLYGGVAGLLLVLLALAAGGLGWWRAVRVRGRSFQDGGHRSRRDDR